MRCFIKFLLAILAFAAIAPVAAQSLPPGPGRTVEVRPEGGGLWNLMHCKGLTPASADGSTGVVYRSNDGGETWYTDGLWKKQGNGVILYADGDPPTPIFECTGLAETNDAEPPQFSRTEGDLIDRMPDSPTFGDDFGNWRNPTQG